MLLIDSSAMSPLLVLTSAIVTSSSRFFNDAFGDRARWKRLQVNGMAKDFGWESAARAYSRIYARIRSTS